MIVYFRYKITLYECKGNKFMKRKLLLLIAISATLFLFACGDENKTTRTVREIPDGVVHKENIIPALDWSRVEQTFTNEDGSTETVWWNITDTTYMGCNFINVFPNYQKDGKSISGAQMTANNYKEILEYCRSTLECSHENDIQVVTSLPMCLIYIDQYDAAGEDWRKFSQVTEEGTNRIDTDDTNIAYACINNPLFQKKVRKCSNMAAEAGYDGVFYDAGPYSYGVRFCCHCKYCEKDWARFTKKYYGKSVDMPSGDPDLSTEIGRLFWKWRHDIFIDFIFSLRDDGREYNESFDIWPNIGMNATHSCYYTLEGLETSMCEYSSNDITSPGIESTMYFFRQYEAENPYDSLIMEFCDIGTQALPEYRYRTAYVEALAGGGTVMASTSENRVEAFADFIKECSEIQKNDPDAFCDSMSIAETAVVYSWQEVNAYHLITGESPAFKQNPPRVAASMLAAEGIPFDYIMPERVTKLSHLQRYKTLIFTEFQLLDKDFEKLVEEYVRGGGQIIILGDSFASQYVVDYGVKYADWESDVLEKWTGTKYSAADSSGTGESFTLGNGKIYVLKKYLRGKVAKEEAVNLFAEANLYDLVKVTEDISGNVETTIRSDATGERWWLNCVSYAGYGVYDDKPITIEVRLPDGENVLSVTSVSPTMSDSETALSWTKEGSTLKITATVGLWTMFKINKK